MKSAVRGYTALKPYFMHLLYSVFCPKLNKHVLSGRSTYSDSVCVHVGVYTCVAGCCQAPVAATWHPCVWSHLLCSLRGTHTMVPVTVESFTNTRLQLRGTPPQKNLFTYKTRNRDIFLSTSMFHTKVFYARDVLD